VTQPDSGRGREGRGARMGLTDWGRERQGRWIERQIDGEEEGCDIERQGAREGDMG